jgi:membrane protease YdiL (CAAX protease family)
MNTTSSLPQYTLRQTLALWAAAALPMGILGWLVAPRPLADPSQFTVQFVNLRMIALTLGLIWQFVLVMFVIYREAGDLRWETLKARLWLNVPVSPKTGEPRKRLWFWIIPLIVVTAAFEMFVHVDSLWVKIFPFFAEPAGYALDTFLGSAVGQAQMVGAWDSFTIFLVLAVFNTFLGEELLFRGLLLPRMHGVFGQWDWLANGILFGLYHIHQPWGMLGSMIAGALLFALPSKIFRNSWFGVILHSGQSVYFLFLILGLVLGLA